MSSNRLWLERMTGVPILGTSADAIDLAEDRKRFQKLLNDLGLNSPPALQVCYFEPRNDALLEA